MTMLLDPPGYYETPGSAYDGVLYGELTADGTKIVLIAEGNDWGISRIGELLRRLTPLLESPKDERGQKIRGPLLCPATWAAVVQLGFTFNGLRGLAWVPQPRLLDWITAEVIRRTSPVPPLDVTWPPWLAPRPYQLDGAAMIAAEGRFLLMDEPGPQPETTPVWTPSGWAELGDLVPGDLVFDRYGRQVPVRTVKHFGEQPVYRVSFSDRTSTLATGSHRWRVWTKNDRTHPGRMHHSHGRVLSTDQILEAGLTSADGGARFYLPQQPVLQGGPDTGLPLDPYAYGALLGDGSLGGAHLSIACPDEYVLRRVRLAADDLGTTSRLNTPLDRCMNAVFHRNGKLRAVLEDLGACKPSNGKAVYPQYLTAGECTRRSLLAGLLDTDGSVASAAVEFSSCSARLAADAAWLARSLGAVVTESGPQSAGYRSRDGEYIPCQDKYRLSIRFPAGSPNPFRLPRKAAAWAEMAVRLQRRFPPRSFASVMPEGTARVCCIELDTDDEYARVYLTDQALIPTHNTGTTITTLLGADARRRRGTDIFPMVIVVPSWDVADHWAREIREWVPDWGIPRMHGGPNRAQGITARNRGQYARDVFITTYATARRDAADERGPLVRLRAAAVLIDEVHLCVSHDTLITVPGGVKAISSIQPGDLVRGVDHATGRATWTRVSGIMRSPLRPVIRLPGGGPALTPEHPVWVSHSGFCCHDNGYDTYPYPMRVLPAGFPASPEDQPVLFPAVHGTGSRGTAGSQGADEQAGTGTEPGTGSGSLPGSRLREAVQAPQQGTAGHPAILLEQLPGALPVSTARGAGTPQQDHEADHQPPGCTGETVCIPHLRPESVPGSGGARKSAGNPGGAGLAEPEWRQWHGAYHPAGEIARLAGARLDDGAGDPDRNAPGQRVPLLLQGRYRSSGPEGGSRGARPGSWTVREFPGPQEEGVPGIGGLDSAVDLERADPRRSLWNLETDTGNYFADGILIHNCRNSSARQTLAVQRIAKHAATVTGLSGTPITRNTGDIHPVLDAMEPASWPSKERFTKRFCLRTEDDYGESVIGLNPGATAEFFAIMDRHMRRAAKADVLDQLPPKIYSVRRPEIPPEWRRAYRTMEEEMLARLPDGGELPVMDTLSQLTRLTQLASSAADVEIEEAWDEQLGQLVPRYRVRLKPPSWKAESLMEIISERPGMPVVAFMASRQLAMITGKHYCEKAGLRTGYITGTGGGVTRATRQQAMADFQAGKLDVIICTAGAGSLGITLTRSDTCVLLQRPWQFDQAVQPEDRLHRISAEIHDKVEIIDIVAKGTVDERVRELLREKAGQLAEFVRDPRIVRELLGGRR